LHKSGKWFADWFTPQGQRLRKAFKTPKAATKYQEKMRRDTAAKKAQAGKRSPISARRGRKPEPTPTEEPGAPARADRRGNPGGTTQPTPRRRATGEMEERGRPGDQARPRVLPPENPRLPQPKRPTGRKVKRSHTRAAKAAPGEIDRLIAVSPPWLRCLLTIAALTGMRRGDCLALSPAHCDDDLTVISLTQAKTKIAVSLPIAPGLQAVLRDAPGPATSANVPYVDRYAGKPVTGSMVDNAMIDALEAQ